MIKDGWLNLKDYGAIGDGVTDDNAAWETFIADCISQKKNGYIPSGIYLIDSFTFGASASGLVLQGTTYNPFGASFGVQNTVLKLKSASPKFINMSAVYNMQISNISFDGGYYADVVVYFDGAVNTPANIFRSCIFANATVTTGIIHHYAGGIVGGENNKFYNCFLSQTALNTTPRPAPYRAAFCVKFNNSNAFLIIYEACEFVGADVLVQQGGGCAHLLNCKFFDVTTAMIEVLNGTQSFMVTNAYNEQSNNVPFLKQTATAGVTSRAPIIVIAPILQSVNSGFVLNCQQPVCIYGGTMLGNIDVNPVATYGLANNIVDSVYFATGYGVTGTGGVTQTISRGCASNFVSTPSKDYGGLVLAKQSQLLNAGTTLDVTNKTWVDVTNTSPQNVTGLTGGLVGQQIVLYFNDGNTTLVDGGNFNLTGSTNVTPTLDSVITFIGRGAAPGLAPTVWTEVSRSIK